MRSEQFARPVRARLGARGSAQLVGQLPMALPYCKLSFDGSCGRFAQVERSLRTLTQGHWASSWAPKREIPARAAVAAGGLAGGATSTRHSTSAHSCRDAWDDGEVSARLAEPDYQLVWPRALFTDEAAKLLNRAS